MVFVIIDIMTHMSFIPWFSTSVIITNHEQATVRIHQVLDCFLLAIPLLLKSLRSVQISILEPKNYSRSSKICSILEPKNYSRSSKICSILEPKYYPRSSKNRSVLWKNLGHVGHQIVFQCEIWSGSVAKFVNLSVIDDLRIIYVINKVAPKK